MSWLAGVDGCRAGWIAALESPGDPGAAPRIEIVPDLPRLLALCSDWAAIAIDMPIGLPERGARACDTRARRLLGAGATSRVFPAPPRSLLDTESYERANRQRRELEDRGLSRQVFAILRRIREVDQALARRPELPLFEVHPELSFRAMAGRERALPRKKSREGLALRAELVARSVSPDCAVARAPAGAARDDLLDACAALWTARRLHAGTACSLLDPPPRDGTGLPMTIWT